MPLQICFKKWLAVREIIGLDIHVEKKSKTLLQVFETNPETWLIFLVYFSHEAHANEYLFKLPRVESLVWRLFCVYAQ